MAYSHADPALAPRLVVALRRKGKYVNDLIHNRLWSSGSGKAGGRGREGRKEASASRGGGERRGVDDAQVAPPVGTRVVFVVPGGEVAVYIRLVDGLGAAQHPIAQHNLAGDAVACVEINRWVGGAIELRGTGIATIEQASRRWRGGRRERAVNF